MAEPTSPTASGRDGAGADRYRIGCRVVGVDGTLGRLSWVVVDPVARTLTHLVVEPPHHVELARLVPIDLVEGGGDPIRLRAGRGDFERLELAEDARFLPDGSFGYPAGQVMAWPYYGLAETSLGVEALPPPVVYDRVPLGEVQVRRGDRVLATDGPIGSVKGLVIDPADHHVTHVLLQEGHLWGRKQVAIPITAVTKGGDGASLAVGLSRHEVHDLPPVSLASSP